MNPNTLPSKEREKMIGRSLENKILTTTLIQLHYTYIDKFSHEPNANSRVAINCLLQVNDLRCRPWELEDEGQIHNIQVEMANGPGMAKEAYACSCSCCVVSGWQMCLAHRCSCSCPCPIVSCPHVWCRGPCRA